MGSCSRVKGCYGDSAAERGMVRLVERKIKVRGVGKGGEGCETRGGVRKRWAEAGLN